MLYQSRPLYGRRWIRLTVWTPVAVICKGCGKVIPAESRMAVIVKWESTSTSNALPKIIWPTFPQAVFSRRYAKSLKKVTLETYHLVGCGVASAQPVVTGGKHRKRPSHPSGEHLT